MKWPGVISKNYPSRKTWRRASIQRLPLFAVGDTVLLREVDEARDDTGTVAHRTITQMQKNYGLPDHLYVLSYGQPAPQIHPECFMNEGGVGAMHARSKT